MRRRLVLLAVAAGLVASPPAQADHWPVAGGNPSRSSYASGVDQTPITPTWSAPDGAVRTPIVITGGGNSGHQRVAYGTADGFLHLRMLESGAPVGPGEGFDLDSGSINNQDTFASGTGSIGFADTSTESRHGVLYVLHNDDLAVSLARQAVDSGAVLSDDAIGRSAQCATSSSPLLTPPAPSGSRILYFTMICSIYQYLVRIPIEGDAASPDATLGTVGFATLNGAVGTASPTLAVFRDEQGLPRYYVVMARRGGLTAFEAEDPLEAEPGNTPTPASITAELADTTEVPQTPVVPLAAGGAVAGAEGSGTGPSPVLYVAADAAGSTRVYRFTQDGNARTLRATAATAPLPASGAPSPGMALSETVTAEGLAPGGTLLVSSATNLTLLRTSDLSIVAQASGTPLPSGLGFSRTVPMVSGAYAFVVRDGDGDSPAEHLVLRLDGLTPLQPPAFSPAPDPVHGPVSGQPAGSHGHAVFGTARGPFAYASAKARDTPRGEVITELPAGACARLLRGTPRGDRLRGSHEGDRILGGGGRDRLFGRGGTDCLFGQAGDDVLSGGNGDDVLEGGPGRDRLSGGRGRNQLRGGSGRDVLRGGGEADRLDAGSGNDLVISVDKVADRVSCGAGRDVARVDRRDRVSRSCERVKKRP